MSDYIPPEDRHPSIAKDGHAPDQVVEAVGRLDSLDVVRDDDHARLASKVPTSLMIILTDQDVMSRMMAMTIMQCMHPSITHAPYSSVERASPPSARTYTVLTAPPLQGPLNRAALGTGAARLEERPPRR